MVTYLLIKIFLQLEVKRRKEEPLPRGWAQDETGTETTDAARAVTKGTLLPLGGTELTSGYKGYGLAFLVELLCGVLAGKIKLKIMLTKA